MTDVYLKIATLIVAVFGAFYAGLQFRMQRRVAKAKFIFDLNAYMASDELTLAIERLEKYRDALYDQMRQKHPFSTPSFVIQDDSLLDESVEKSLKEEITRGYWGSHGTQVPPVPTPVPATVPPLVGRAPLPDGATARFAIAHNDVTKIWPDVRNLTRFFESIMFMIETEVLTDAEVFRPMGYRMLLVLNCPLVQKRLLFSYDEKTQKIRPKYSFLALFALHRRLMDFYKDRFQWHDDKGVKFDLLLEDYKVHPRYELKNSAHLLWQDTAVGSSEIYQAALDAYEKYKDQLYKGNKASR
ncbi:MAG: hypothetical protein EOP04_19935 [Proteobacteria bacterium]|nr:MAG: hypothetical protein EOP04_19935 [Pseudomonadota bacterium]